jgi:hypothetical protein
LRRILYLAAVAFLAMMVLVPSALAQDLLPGDDDPMSPEPEAVAVSSHEELAQIAGQPPPTQGPTSEPLPKTGGPAVGALAVVLPAAAALLLGSGVLAYGVLRKKQQEKGGSA